MRVPFWLKKAVTSVRDTPPVVWTTVNVVGTVVTVIAGSTATIQAVRILEEDRAMRADARNDGAQVPEITPVETIGLTWKCYIPTALLLALTAGSAIASHKVHTRQNMVLATLYSASDLALKEYQRKVVETIGEKKEEAIRHEVVKERLESRPISENQIIFTGTGDSLCFDNWTGRYFKSDIETLRQIRNEINREVISEMFVPVNELYYRLRISNVQAGEDVGWDVDNMLEFRFDSHLSETGQPCLAVEYAVVPKFKLY